MRVDPFNKTRYPISERWPYRGRGKLVVEVVGGRCVCVGGGGGGYLLYLVTEACRYITLILSKHTSLPLPLY